MSSNRTYASIFAFEFINDREWLPIPMLYDIALPHHTIFHKLRVYYSTVTSLQAKVVLVYYGTSIITKGGVTKFVNYRRYQCWPTATNFVTPPCT